MKISHFTSHALFHPASGYYRTCNPLDDFITAPENSQVFGELIAAYILQISSTKKSKISLVEMGAGKGTLFFDILSTVKKLAEKKNPQAIDFLERTTFHIIEINEVLKKIQREKLKDFAVNWHENFDGFLSEDLSKTGFVTPSSRSDQTQVDVNGTWLQTPSSAREAHRARTAPSPLRGEGWGEGGLESKEIFFISNELFDCFPIDQFVKTDIGWCERLIDSGKFVTANFNPEIHQFVESEVKENVPFGAVFEHSSAAKNFMSQLCEALKKHGGIAINFDYGYAKTEFANTLQAVKKYQKVSIFEKDCDITAHVDFSALEKIAKNFGLNSSLITQREFLISLGIEERRKILPPSENSAIDRLIAPDQMGELFKCLIIWK